MIVKTVPTNDQIIKALSEKELADFIRSGLENSLKKSVDEHVDELKDQIISKTE